MQSWAIYKEDPQTHCLTVLGRKWCYSIFMGWLIAHWCDSPWCFPFEDPTQRWIEPRVFLTWFLKMLLCICLENVFVACTTFRNQFSLFKGAVFFAWTVVHNKNMGLVLVILKRLVDFLKPLSWNVCLVCQLTLAPCSYILCYSSFFIFFYFFEHVFILLLIYCLSPYSGVIMLTNLRVFFLYLTLSLISFRGILFFAKFVLSKRKMKAHKNRTMPAYVFHGAVTLTVVMIN